MSGLANFEIYPAGPRMDVWVNEQRLEGVIGYQLTHDPGHPARLAVILGLDSGPVQGNGIVEIHRTGVDTEILQKIANLNPALVEEKAMESLGWGDSGNVVSAVIQTILEMCRADQPDGSPKGNGEAAVGGLVPNPQGREQNGG